MRLRVSKRELLRRIEALEADRRRPSPAPLDGQQTLPVAVIADHHYEGAGGPCTADTFGVECRGPQDAHQTVPRA